MKRDIFSMIKQDLNKSIKGVVFFGFVLAVLFLLIIQIVLSYFFNLQEKNSQFSREDNSVYFEPVVISYNDKIDYLVDDLDKFISKNATTYFQSFYLFDKYNFSATIVDLRSSEIMDKAFYVLYSDDYSNDFVYKIFDSFEVVDEHKAFEQIFKKLDWNNGELIDKTKIIKLNSPKWQSLKSFNINKNEILKLVNNIELDKMSISDAENELGEIFENSFINLIAIKNDELEDENNFITKNILPLIVSELLLIFASITMFFNNIFINFHEEYVLTMNKKNIFIRSSFLSIVLVMIPFTIMAYINSFRIDKVLLVNGIISIFVFIFFEIYISVKIHNFRK